MTGKEIEGFLLTEDGTAQFITIKDDLSTYYEILNCSTIEMPMRTIGGLRYTIICDEEGGPMMREGAVPTVFGLDGKPMIYGSVFFCLVDDEGECQSLTKAHCVNLGEYLFVGVGPKGARLVMSGADY